LNEQAVKELTKKGCMVDREAAEQLTEQDVEAILDLDTTPMYISEKMLSQIRKQRENNDNDNHHSVSSGKTKQIVKTKQEEKKERKDLDDNKNNITDNGNTSDYDYGETSSKFAKDKTVQIRDERNKNKLETKVEVLDHQEIKKEEKDIPEFLQYYNDRYEKMKKILTRRRELKSATTINRLERKDEGDDATTIGMVNDKYSTRNGKYIVEIEDNTGSFKLLVDEREGSRIVQDEVIGVIGSMGGDIIYADKIVWPDLPIPQGKNTTKDEVYAAYISDLHIGSEDTLTKRLNRFAQWLSSKQAEKIGYLVITGDMVEGAGIYPGQDEELVETDIYKQYQMFEEWFEKIPEHIQVIVGPGNHDIVRLAEPQPKIPEKALSNIKDYNNLHLVQNPQMVRLHAIRSKGIKNLMYHGYSFDGHTDQLQELREGGYENPEKVMIDLLKRRHLGPTYGTNLVSPEETDRLVIEQKPDIFVAGHFHSHANSTYKGVNVICSSTFQGQTDFQKRVGHEPDPGKVTLVNFKTRNTKVKQF